MKFGLNIPLPLLHGGFQSPASVKVIAHALDKSRADIGHVTDHPAPDAHWLHNDPAGHDALDPFTELAFIAANTSRLRVQTSVLVLPYRNPFITAKAAATLHVLSGGRLVLGVGAGYQKGEFEAMGVPFKERGALTDEALEVIRMAWAGGAVVRKGRYFDAKGNEPRPALPSPPPIWVGGGSDKAVERAARWGDGWMPFLTRPANDPEIDKSSVKTNAELADKIARIRQLREEFGKSPDFEINVAPHWYPADRSRAAVDTYCEQINELKALGVTSLTAVIREQTLPAYLDTLAWYDEEVMARFD